MASIYIETYGCAFNISDSEALGGVLTQAGFSIVESEDEADVVVLNSCTVKDRTYLDFQKRLKSLRSHNGTGPAVVVAGCVPKANPGEPLLEGVVQIGANNLSEISEAVHSALRNRPFRQLEPRDEDRVRMAGRRRNPAIEILPINQGCLSACAFCQTRLARGRLHSFPLAEIVERARRAIGEGVREVWLTSQDTGAYGADIGACLPQLLQALISLEGDFKIRLGMSSPQWIRRDLAALLDLYQSPRLYQFLHIPVQSGDGRVLHAMKRGHSVADYEESCNAFVDRSPDMAIWTDIIAGFPTETDEEFEHSLDLVRRTRPATINRSRFSPRPGTVAAQMPQWPSAVITRRSQRLNRVVESISRQNLRRWIGWEGEVLVSEIKKAGSVVCRNHAYRPVVLQGQFQAGQKIKVRILDSTTYHLIGEALSL